MTPAKEDRAAETTGEWVNAAGDEHEEDIDEALPEGVVDLPESLAVAPKQQDVKVDENAYLDLADDLVDTKTADLDIMAERASQWAQKMESDAGKGKAKEITPPAVPGTSAVSPTTDKKRSEAKPSRPAVSQAARGTLPTRESGKSRGGARGASRSAQMALKMARATPKTPAIKPVVKPAGASQGPQEAKEQPSASTPTAPVLGDEAFPPAAVPPLSEEYDTFSMMSSVHEGLQNEMTGMEAQLQILIRGIADQNLRFAKLQGDIDVLKQDQSSATSAVYDRIRDLERKLKHDPALTTSATQVVPLVPSSSKSVSPKPAGKQGTMTFEEQLEAFKKLKGRK